MKIVYAYETPPESYHHSIFLAGPTPRSEDESGWRQEAVAILEDLHYEGVVFIPEPRDGKWSESYDDQVEWEVRWLDRCDTIAFWVPRDLKTMPAFTTNVEFGRYVDSGRVVYGRPPNAPKNRYLDFLTTRDKLNPATTYDTLQDVLDTAIEGNETMPQRWGGERFVPALVWRADSFRAWLWNLQAVGNRLDDFRSLWTFRIKGKVFSWVGQVDVWIESEQRHKTNEFVFSRVDVACTVLYCEPLSADDSMLDTTIVLVREFRSPGRTEDGFVWELPGGSVDPHEVNKQALAAAREAHEETGLIIPIERLRHLASRQAAGTLSSHKVHAYACELKPEEMAQAIRLAQMGEAKGEVHDTERCYTEVTTLREMFAAGNVDWTTLGVVFQALLR